MSRSMKSPMKKILTFAMIMVIATCGMPVGTLNAQAKTKTTAKAKKKIRLNKKKATLRVGKKLKLKVKGVSKKTKVKWKSSNKKVATVTKKGVVKAKKKGKVTIRAKVKGKTLKCKITVKAKKKPKAVTAGRINGSDVLQAVYLTDNLYDKENIIISPTSLNIALGLAANGANDSMKKEFETYLGCSISDYNNTVMKMMNNAESDDMISLANSVWYRNTYTLQSGYESIVKHYYKADIKCEAFDDTTVDNVNNWASEKTDGMIKKIISNIEPSTQALLINALLFDGKWTNPFESNRTYEREFTKFGNKTVETEMMHETLKAYYENDYATGFEKTYGKNKKYSFIAILPKSKGEFKMSDLDMEGFMNTKTTKYKVNIALPKFEYSWNDSLKEVLMKTSVANMFVPQLDPMANLLNTSADEKTYVSDVMQSCKIKVDEEGTKAAAVTTIAADTTSAVISTEIIKSVKLDRPFAYVIKDNKTNQILFMGKVVDPTEKD